MWTSDIADLVVGKEQEGEGQRGLGAAVFGEAGGQGGVGWRVEGGGNVSVKEHIVRDMRQQMERRGPEWLTAPIHQKEEMVGDWGPVSTEQLGEHYEETQ